MTALAPDLATVCAVITEAPRKGLRRLVAVAGAPAGGKSTLAVMLAQQLNATGHKAQVVPMDGFHLDNRVLDQRGLRARKGAPETFDAGGLIRLVEGLATEETVYFPIFDRSQDLAIAGGGVVGPDIETVIVEGNYLLFNAAPWRSLAPLWDISLFLNVPEETLRSRLIDRWLAHDHTQTQAEERAEGNDLANARRVIANRLPCDIEIAPAS